MSSAAVGRDSVSAPVKVRPKHGLRRLALAGTALVVAGGVAWYGYDWWTTGRFIETTDDAYVGGDVTALAPHVAGFVAEIAVTDNEHVTAGQLLVRLDVRDYRTALAHADATVQERTAMLANLHARTAQQQSMIRQAEADLAAKAARAEFAKTDAARYRTLAQTSAGSQQDAQRARTVDQESRGTVLSAQAALDVAHQQLDVLGTETDAAEAALAEARSDQQTAQLNLGYTEIRAPIDGYIGNRVARVGEYLAAGSYLLSVIPAHGLWVDANFKEDQLARMAQGQAVTVIADTLPGHTFNGRLASFAPGTGAVFSVIPPENATGNFTKIVQRVPVRVVLDPADATLPRLRPGLSTTVRIDTRTAP